MTSIRDVIIVGSGPAGYTAAIYAARANLNPLVLAGMLEPGGELMKTTDVENFPGFPEGITGPELMEHMARQAERFGAEIIYEDAASVDLRGEIKTVTDTDGFMYRARTVIIATGSAYRKLGLADEERLSGHGVSYCATCDGSFFSGQEVVVVGGGDSAMEEALFLTKFATKVTVMVRGAELRASKIMADRARAHPKIHFMYGTAPKRLKGGEYLTEVVADFAEGPEVIPATGLFVAIGNDPRTDLIRDQLELDENAGTIKVQGRSSRTSLPGVFAAGDVIDPTYRQAITAASSGCVAAQDVEHYLAGLPAQEASTVLAG